MGVSLHGLFSIPSTQPRAPGRFASSYRASSRRFEHRSGSSRRTGRLRASYRAEHGRLYRTCTPRRPFPLELGGELVSVRPDPVHDADVLEEVSKAYLAKYDGEPELDDMVSPPVIATTLRLVPVGS